ncbi:uncharacterized protein LOC122254897 [Penaeus japonicus]|uniref:uncharacterized protein LOC122254897 n=1 Tax=Penaeus japonicus TaxID=27405 RepID=UPI001C70C2FF|nr:uncharacterized protein LOC122254897 [Penaeus japonicus]
MPAFAGCYSLWQQLPVCSLSLLLWQNKRQRVFIAIPLRLPLLRCYTILLRYTAIIQAAMLFQRVSLPRQNLINTKEMAIDHSIPLAYTMEAEAPFGLTSPLQFLSKNVTVKTFLEVFEIATLMNDQKVLSRCDDILATESDLVLRSERLGILRPHNLARLLANDRLAASSESLVFRALLAWGRAKLDDSPAGRVEGSKTSDMQEQGPRPKKQAKRCPPSGQPVGSQSESQESNALRNVVKEFLPSIRFLTMSTDEFVKHVLPSRVLTSDEAMAVLMNIKNIPDVPLPNIASCTSRQRQGNLLYEYTEYSSDSDF